MVDPNKAGYAFPEDEAVSTQIPISTLRDTLLQRIKHHRSLCVLTGAGISEPSGIPTYRDKNGRWQRTNPIQHQEFIKDESKRKRYWARSMVGWKPVSKAKPNPAHFALAKLEQHGKVNHIITQNVDRLHQRAGSQSVTDLHGRLDVVKCLQCDVPECRDDVQRRLETSNPGLANRIATLAPDGDAYVEDYPLEKFILPHCLHCHGTLMPDVVFFGGQVPKKRLEFALNKVVQADALIVVGSSLVVYSGFRFCKYAHQHAKPMYCINDGRTRADDLFDLKLRADCVSTLEHISQAFCNS